MATRTEARAIADQLCPEGFTFNSLQKTPDEQWIATFVDGDKPPHVIIERWHDFYTEDDPEPETDETDTTDESDNEEGEQE